MVVSASSALVFSVQIGEEVDQGWKVGHRDIRVAGQACSVKYISFQLHGVLE